MCGILTPDGEKIAKSVIAFANSVRADGAITGIDTAELFALKDKVANIIHDSISPNAFPETYVDTLGKS